MHGEAHAVAQRVGQRRLGFVHRIGVGIEGVHRRRASGEEAREASGAAANLEHVLGVQLDELLYRGRLAALSVTPLHAGRPCPPRRLP
jgi:hypothetical protein